MRVAVLFLTVCVCSGQAGLRRGQGAGQGAGQAGLRRGQGAGQAGLHRGKGIGALLKAVFGFFRLFLFLALRTTTNC